MNIEIVEDMETEPDLDFSLDVNLHEDLEASLSTEGINIDDPVTVSYTHLDVYKRQHLTGASKPKDFQENTDIDISLEAFESGYNPLGEIKKQRREGTMHE